MYYTVCEIIKAPPFFQMILSDFISNFHPYNKCDAYFYSLLLYHNLRYICRNIPHIVLQMNKLFLNFAGFCFIILWALISLVHNTMLDFHFVCYSFIVILWKAQLTKRNGILVSYCELWTRLYSVKIDGKMLALCIARWLCWGS